MAKPSGWHRKNPNNPASIARKRKYDSAEHRAARAHYRKLVEYGLATCWRCTLPITAGTRWHVGHDDNNINLIRGPEHARCNLHAAARKGARISNARRKAKAFVRPTR